MGLKKLATQAPSARVKNWVSKLTAQEQKEILELRELFRANKTKIKSAQELARAIKAECAGVGVSDDTVACWLRQ